MLPAIYESRLCNDALVVLELFSLTVVCCWPTRKLWMTCSHSNGIIVEDRMEQLSRRVSAPSSLTTRRAIRGRRIEVGCNSGAYVGVGG